MCLRHTDPQNVGLFTKVFLAICSSTCFCLVISNHKVYLNLFILKNISSHTGQLPTVNIYFLTRN